MHPSLLPLRRHGGPTVKQYVLEIPSFPSNTHFHFRSQLVSPAAANCISWPPKTCACIDCTRINTSMNLVNKRVVLLVLVLQPWIYSTARNAVSQEYVSCVNSRFRVTKGMIFVIAFFHARHQHYGENNIPSIIVSSSDQIWKTTGKPGVSSR
jgi:hypothetical protein